MDNIPEGAIPVGQFEPAEAQQQSNIPLGAIPVDKFEPQEKQQEPVNGMYGSIPQQAVTALEGAAQGFMGPLAPLIETKALGVPAEDIAAREQVNPNINAISKYGALAGSLLTGTGEAGLLAKGMGKLLPEASTALGKIGMSALSNGIQMGAIQGGDELSKAMLGQGNPEAPVSSIIMHIGGAGLLGALSGGAFNAIGQGSAKGLSALENSKIGDKANDLIAGMGMAAKAHQAGIPAKEAEEWLTKYFQDFGAGSEFNYKAYKPGVDFYYNGLKNIVGSTAIGLGGAAGEVVNGPVGAIVGAKVADKYLTPVIEKVLNRPLIGMSKLVTPTLMKALSVGQTSGLLDMLNYASKASKGDRMCTNAVESLFKAGIPVSISNSDNAENKIREFIDEGGINQQLQNQLEQNPSQYAQGGEVDSNSDHPIANVYPEQNIMLNAARGRVFNYLNSIKPQDTLPKLAFDKDFKNEESHRTYDRAIKIAANPISVLKHVKDNTIQAEHVQHLNSMFPEAYQYLKNKLVSRISSAQYNEDPPPDFATRQAMSMFLGTPLESSFTPQNILAAQATYLPQIPPQQPQGKTKRGTSTLGKDNKSYRTPNQAAEADKQDRR